MSIFRLVGQLLFPESCAGCGTVGSYLCTSCKHSLVVHQETCPVCHRHSPHYHVCHNCQKEFRPLQGIVIGFGYSGLLKKLILKLKYYHVHSLSTFFAKKLSYLVMAHPQLSHAREQKHLVVSYIPTHWYRRWFIKGYNQSKLLSRHLGHELDIPVFTEIWKNKYTISQTTLRKTQRHTNLKNSFSSKTNHTLDGKLILLVDDITTTGSTLHEVAKTVHAYNPTCTFRGIVVGRHGR